MNSPSAQTGTLSESEGQPPNPTTAPHPDVYLEASPDPHIQSHQPAMSIASMAYNQSTVLPPNSKVAPYSVNGISLSSPNVDMMHPAMGYPGELTNISLSPCYRILGIFSSKMFRRNPLLTVSCIYFFDHLACARFTRKSYSHVENCLLIFLSGCAEKHQL